MSVTEFLFMTKEGRRRYALIKQNPRVWTAIQTDALSHQDADAISDFVHQRRDDVIVLGHTFSASPDKGERHDQ